MQPPPPSNAGIPVAGEADPGYLRVLLALLASAAFFHGYDLSILALLLPDLQASFGVGEAELGLTRIPIELGLLVAFFVARLCDRFGRRPLLLGSVVGYSTFTALTVLSWDLWSFAAFQFGSRIFLGAEFAVAVTMVVEEFPADRRGRALGSLLSAEALGTVTVAALLGTGLQSTSLGWRAFFLVGLGPLAVIGVYRRRLRETRRFGEGRSTAGSVADDRRAPFLQAWQPPYRALLLRVGLVQLFRSIPFYGATAWWAFFVQRERGFTERRVAAYVLCAFVAACASYHLCGRMMDRVGRRPTAMVYLAIAISSTIWLFQAEGRVALFVALVVAVSSGLGVQPVLSAFSTELFPTAIRGQAAAWVRCGFDIAGAVVGPAVVGVLGDDETGLIGSIGDTVTGLVLLALPALWLIRRLPEAAHRELEEIASPAARSSGTGGGPGR